MKIIILAAGTGERLLPLTKNIPKPLIKIKKNKTLLEIQIENIKKSNSVNEIIIVAGHFVEKIEEKISKIKIPNLKIKIIYNPFYKISNNLVSLWIAKDEMNDDFLITNGDNIFSPQIFSDIINSKKNKIVLTTSRKKLYNEDDMKVTILKNNISYVSKKIIKKKISAESPGLAKISGKKNITEFKKVLNKLVRNQDNLNKFWLEVFNQLYLDGVKVENFSIEGDKNWREVDFHPDLKELRNIISKSSNIYS